MRPLSINDPEIILGLQDEIRRSEESRYGHRLHGLLLVAHGLSCREVAQLLGNSPRTVQPARKSVGYFGAVRLRDGKLAYRREDHKSNAETFLAFLKQLKQSACRSGRRVVVLLDNARYHHGTLYKDWRALHCKQFQLDYLPPYSPELDPIERVWKLTRRK